MEQNRLTALLASLGVDRGLEDELRELLGASFDASELADAWPTGPLAEDLPELPERYEDRGLLGRGGMGEVRRVWDRVLEREVALKVVRADLALAVGVDGRFVAEARATARLAHPGIVPVYDHGFLPDGRPYFTMQEVRGETVAASIEHLHRSEGDPRIAFRRLIDAVRHAADAVGFAHDRGVIHRDIKPANLLVGEHGEVRVVDWGLFRPDPSWDGPPALVAAIAGTPAYMAPEQARGDLDRIDARSDVYALGCVLWEVLTGRPPFRGLGMAAILARVARGETPPRPLTPFAGVEDLIDLVVACVDPRPEARPAAAGDVAAALRRWLDGETRRDRARSVLETARQLEVGLTARVLQATAARTLADRLLRESEPWEPDAARETWWAADDAATALERACRADARAIDEALEAALTHDPDAVEVRAAAAERALALHARSEADGQIDATATAQLRLARHIAALPPSHPQRVRVERWLVGDGALTLHTDPPGARAVLHRYEVVRRRLVPVVERELGPTPLDAVPIPFGRWLVTIHAEGRPVVRYPIRIGREEHWDGVPPGGGAPRPIVLPASLAPDECYVPAGWCRVGGDPEASHALPSTRVWVDGFAMRRFVVTNAEYVAFLEDVARTDRDLADRYAPRDHGRTPGTWGKMFYGYEDGRYLLPTDAEGDTWQPDWPVLFVDQVAARACARWLGWRLPGELEWEKAARAGDGRIYPWGDAFDPSWSGTRPAFRGAPRVEPVTARPLDESVYGVRGMSGQVVEWTADRFAAEGPTPNGGRVVVPDGADDGEDAWLERTSLHRIVGRGGSRTHDAKAARSAFRTLIDPWSRASNVGIRLARDLG